MRKTIVASLAATLLLALAPAAMATQEAKVAVCKYVGTPGVDETLKAGKQPIEVSANALEGTGFNGTFPFEFSDAQGRSVAIGYADEGLTAEDCPAPIGPPEPELVEYRVVAGMPRYRGDVFLAEPGLTCTLKVSAGLTKWTAFCGDHVDSGAINRRQRTYVRLRIVGQPGPEQVLLDLR